MTIDKSVVWGKRRARLLHLLFRPAVFSPTNRAAAIRVEDAKALLHLAPTTAELHCSLQPLYLVPQDEVQARWFETHLKPHEAMLRSWLQARFSGEHEADDIVQEAFLRVLHMHQSTPIASPKAYLFATARNLALARLRHGNLVTQHSLAEMDLSAVLDEAAGVPDTVAHSEELEILTKAIQSLPTRCRQILTLRKIYGLPQREVARQLGIAEHTVEAQGTIGIRKIAEFFERYNRRGE